MTKKKEVTIPVLFKWVSFSPDPHDVTMRSNLEPVETFVEIEIPQKHEYIANVEKIIREQLGEDFSVKARPLLTPEGMRYATRQLSLKQVAIEEELDDEDWDSEDENWDDETTEENSEKLDDDIEWEDE